MRKSELAQSDSRFFDLTPQSNVLEFGDVDGAAPSPFELAALRAMSEAWRQGLRPRAEEWLESTEKVDPQVAVRIIYEEVCLRQEHGETIVWSEVYVRFPQWRGDLEMLFECHRLLQAKPTFPVAGERLGEFQLLTELDRGAVGRVFLATQPMLSDRALVIKLTPASSDEHLSLARLQHSHIVPLYLVQDFPAQRLRALCMPYLGGTSLGRLLGDLKATPPPSRSGKQLVELLARLPAGVPAATSFTGPALSFLQRASYVQAVCWIGACLADALHYAHQRGFVHLDVKPSNVLLAGDGQPMLLDFHLATETTSHTALQPMRLGGTREYMSPEQRQTIAQIASGQPVETSLDGRSDVYSLGVLLYESLCGELPPPGEGALRFNPNNSNANFNADVSRGLQDILRKCLAADPAHRYGDAAELATDLRRHLVDLPLLGVSNRSIRERCQKWRRRRPHALLFIGLIASAVVAIGTLGSLFLGERRQEARRSLAQGKEQLQSRDLGMAIDELQTGQSAARWLPGERELKQALSDELSVVRRARLGEGMHKLVNGLRFLEPFDDMPPENLRELASKCSEIWRAGAKTLPPLATAGDQLADEELRNDLLDLALLWTQLHVRAAAPERLSTARRDAVQILTDAERLCGECAIVTLVRGDYEGRSTQPSPAVAKFDAPNVSAWEYDAFGRYWLHANQVEQAQRAFQQAIDIEPSAFWPNFHFALCAYRLNNFSQALCATSVCVALVPTRAECFFNRGLAEQALGDYDRALSDFDRAIALDKTLSAARLARAAIVHRPPQNSEPQAVLE